MSDAARKVMLVSRRKAPLAVTLTSVDVCRRTEWHRPVLQSIRAACTARIVMNYHLPDMLSSRACSEVTSL